MMRGFNAAGCRVANKGPIEFLGPAVGIACSVCLECGIAKKFPFPLFSDLKDVPIGSSQFAFTRPLTDHVLKKRVLLEWDDIAREATD